MRIRALFPADMRLFMMFAVRAVSARRRVFHLAPRPGRTRQLKCRAGETPRERVHCRGISGRLTFAADPGDNIVPALQELDMKLSDIIVSDAIVPDLKAKTRDEAINELVGVMAKTKSVAPSKVAGIIKAVKARESQATTGIGKGVALPHAKLQGIKKPIGTIGRSSEGIDFSALDSKPVYSIILLLSSQDDPDKHLQAMETIFKHVQRDTFRKFLRQSETREAIVDLIQEADELG